jgi:hypothetical protein
MQEFNLPIRHRFVIFNPVDVLSDLAESDYDFLLAFIHMNQRQDIAHRVNTNDQVCSDDKVVEPRRNLS